MSSSSAPPFDLPEELESLRQEAKEHAREGDFARAREKNLALRDRSRALGSALGEVLGLRFVGLCEYRMGWYEASERSLQEALALARARACRSQVLLISNHLGATVRRLGRLADAHDLFKESLANTQLPADLDARARLLGNLGALLDVIGDLRAADDCYARYEELVELIVGSGDSDDLARLANARALSARAASRRGDLDTAKAKHDDEHRLAHSCGDAIKKLGATLHQGKIERDLGQRAVGEVRARHFEAAHRWFAEALSEAERLGQSHRSGDASYHWGRLFEAEGRWAEAHGRLVQALKLSQSDGHTYLQAEVCHALTRLCQQCSLHGEALFYLRKTAELRNGMYRPLLDNERIRDMAQTRLAELSGLASSLVDEARRVDRPEEDLADLKKLVESISGKPFSATVPRVDDVWQWQRSIREGSRERWSKLLSKEVYDRLGEQSKADLVMADVAYHGAIDDLPRSAHLLALVIEREVRERLLVPLHERYRSAFGSRPTGDSNTTKYLRKRPADRHHAPLGDALVIIEELCAPAPTDPGVDFAREQVRSCRGALNDLRRLRDPITPLGSHSSLTLRKLRNDAAHGNPGSASLDRLSVDAVKRALVLEAPVILRSLTEIDLRRR
ncbi:tetratricopeptide repeat protein [Polyangium jinanense]|uniref:Tetratricopeptide repeat protein n=1 Tax=Polyangium jinanense TaxID=2829994 RepID=A0A9X4APS5_9BACT|nr:tetratricopeptide repeat protein [Polyangium jinanense]MDC3952699.1 tetratricopeptide repeat protein [Polyangium jinanense]MDC3980318.1 tetratricopeptide repeat protein [Polyangium jinanense]